MEDTQFRETAKIAVGPNVEGLEQQAVAAQQADDADGLIQGDPLNLTDAERAALPPLAPLGEGTSENVLGVSTAEPNPES